MQKPYFSICIPFYNSSSFIKECLDSISRQSFTDIEIIIYNDGSTKKETECLKKILSSYNNKINYIQNEKNLGSYYARTEMIKNVNGFYMLSLDADDAFITNDALSLIKENIDTSKSEIILFNAVRIKRQKKKYLDYSKLHSQEHNINVLRQEFSNACYLNSLCFKAISTKLLSGYSREINSRLTICDDRVIFAYILDKASTFSVLDKPLYYYRLNEASIMSNTDVVNSIKYYIDAENVVNKYIMKWNEVKYDKDAFILQSGIYSCLYNVCLINTQKNYRINCYKTLSKSPVIKNICFGLNKIMWHRRLALKMFFDNKFFALDSYLSIIIKSKKLYKRNRTSNTI